MPNMLLEVVNTSVIVLVIACNVLAWYVTFNVFWDWIKHGNSDALVVSSFMIILSLLMGIMTIGLLGSG